MTTTIISSNYQKFIMAFEMLNETTFEMKKQIRQQKYGFEYYTRYLEKTYFIRALYFQATIGDVNKNNGENLYDDEDSYMWRWIHGNGIFNEWEKLKNMKKEDAEELFISEWDKLKGMLPNYMKYWKLLHNPQFSEDELEAKRLELSIPEDENKNNENEDTYQDIEWIIDSSIESSDEEDNNM